MSPKPDVSVERKQQIFEAAISCFGRQGYHKTKMDDIAAEAGLSKGSLYWYFKSKKELFLALFQEIITQLEYAWQQVIADEGKSATDKVLATLNLFRAEFGELSSFFGVMMEAWAQTLHDEDVTAVLDDFYTPYVKMMTSLIEEGIANNEFQVTNAEATALAILSLLDGVTLGMGTGVIKSDWNVLFDAVSELVLRGLGVGLNNNGN